MKISKLFHFLYFSVMALPLVLIPIFAIYSMNHDIEGNSINTSGYEVRNKYETNEVNNLNDIVLNHIYFMSDLSITAGDFSSNFTMYVFSYESVSFDAYDGEIPSGLDVSYSYNSNEQNYLEIYYAPDYAEAYFTNGNLYYTVEYDSFDFHFTNINFLLKYGVENFINAIVESGYGETDIDKSDFQVLEYVYNEGIVLDDTDIMSQFLYCQYNAMDKYLGMYKYEPFNSIYVWTTDTFFGGNAPLIYTIFYQMFSYWLFVSLAWLVFDVLMYVPMVAHRWLDKGALQ